MATTHLEPLKAFASTHPGARNASVEFDGSTLTPTFRLLYDRPGQSYALSIAARFGLAPELLARAHAHRSAQGARMSELLARLDAQARSETERTIALERRERRRCAVEARAHAEARRGGDLRGRHAGGRGARRRDPAGARRRVGASRPASGRQPIEEAGRCPGAARLVRCLRRQARVRR
jgi:hypothetical protein